MDNRNPLLDKVENYLKTKNKPEFFVKSLDAASDLKIKAKQFSSAMKAIRANNREFEIEKRKKVWLVKKK